MKGFVFLAGLAIVAMVAVSPALGQQCQRQTQPAISALDLQLLQRATPAAAPTAPAQPQVSRDAIRRAVEDAIRDMQNQSPPSPSDVRGTATGVPAGTECPTGACPLEAARDRLTAYPGPQRPNTRSGVRRGLLAGFKNYDSLGKTASR